jgi:hypothetical protein
MVDMNIRYHMLLTVCITAVFVCLCIGSDAIAQAVGIPVGPPPSYYYPPPTMTPTYTGTLAGPFYLNAGVKFRNIATVRFTVPNHSFLREDPGTVPFGPNTPGILLYPYSVGPPVLPTGVFANGPNLSGIWEYNDGQVDPRRSTASGNPNNTTFAPPDLTLGHFNLPAAAEGTSGFFIVSNPPNQTDNAGGPYAGTSQVSFTKRIDGTYGGGSDGTAVGTDPVIALGDPSFVFAPNGAEGPTLEFTNKIWTPYIEVGVAYSTMFDWFLGASWFTLAESFLTTRPIDPFPLARRAFRDSFAFTSGNAAQSWVVANFTSDIPTPNANPDTTQIYDIFPAGKAGGASLPTRTFLQVVDPTVNLIQANETLFNRLDLTVIEFKAGGRSWIPLWGLGRFGTMLGGLVTPMPYKVAARSQVTTTADVLDVNGAVVVPAGTILIDEPQNQWSTAWAFGLFGGVDVEVGNPRFFVKTGLEYDWYFDFTGLQFGQPVENRVNLSGVGATGTLGVRF